MNTRISFSRFSFALTASLLVALLAGCATVEGWIGMGTKLKGSEEVPPVTTSASGTSTIAIKDDRSVSGSVKVSDIKPTAAHIHEGAPGKNGPVIIPLTKTSDTEFMVPANTKLTDAQFKAFKAGNLYVNVHSAAHPGGEIRAQLKP